MCYSIFYLVLLVMFSLLLNLSTIDACRNNRSMSTKVSTLIIHTLSILHSP